MVIGVIPARKGSRGIPNKNMADLGGRPLIAHSFETACSCRLLDRIFLTTDMEDAADLARQYSRVEVPFKRPPHLCQDATDQVEVVRHFLDFVKTERNLSPDVIVLLQPTCPFRTAAEVDGAITIFRERKLQSLMGVAPVMHHPADYLYRESDASPRFHWVMRSEKWRRRQDFPEVFFNTGALYIVTRHYFVEHQRFYDETTYLYRMSPRSLVDIDDAFTIQLARGLLLAGG